MTNHIRKPYDAPRTRRFNGDTYAFWRYEFGRRAYQDLKQEARRLKDQGVIRNYRIVPYENLMVRTAPDGRERPRRIHVLYTR